ncbi:unnamed protein product [Rotaria sp. Silwood1]|nr:unnamed protein product [Rotaria sp. Silwood1]CAF3337481.1 unnamed protein product [Rotaria sp. Silwood1]CAF4754868.1 unnamed protein product [Rotaria sp. Silwood1]
MADARDNHGNEIPNEFFSTFHHISERQEIYNQLTDENRVKELYKIYYSDESYNSKFIEEKANQCSKKYQLKIQNLKLRHAYYIIDTSTPPALTTISCTN